MTHPLGQRIITSPEVLSGQVGSEFVIQLELKRIPMQMFYIGFLGGLGCLCRYAVSGWTHALLGRGLPYGTLVVNVAGSFLLGLIMEGSLRSVTLSQELRMGLTVGFLGGFTTFSSFSYETIRLLEEGRVVAAGGNALLNVLVCVVLAWAGIVVARQF